MNSSNSTKKEKINITQDLKTINNHKKSILDNNLKLNIKDNISSEILNNVLKGIISLKKNDIFDYIIKMLKIILYNYKGNNIINGNNFIFEINVEDNALNLLYQNIFQVYTNETIVRNILMKDFNNNKKIFKNIHYIFIFYIYCGIEHIFHLIEKQNNKLNNINKYIDYNEILHLLFQINNKEQCFTCNKNNNNNVSKKNEACLLCSEINKFKYIINYINSDKDINSNSSHGKILLNLDEKKVFDYAHKNLKKKVKIKKNISNFINSDIGLKLLKPNFSNKTTKINDNQNITNNSHDKRLLNYLKTTIDDKIKIKTLNSHREFEVGNKEQFYSDLNNFIQYKNNNKKNSNKSMNKIYNYSYKNNILNIKTSSIKEKNNITNFLSEKYKKYSSKKRQKKSNININNNHHIYFYPKVEQYLNNIYIINDNDNKNIKMFKEENINIQNKEIALNKDNKNSNKNENEKENILNYMNIINEQINSMDDIFNNFKLQTMEIKNQMFEIINKK